MSSFKHAEAIYRDFEKLYRLSGLYKGNMRQIEKQLAFVNNNLQTHLVTPHGRGGVLRFDLLMSSVFYKGEEVFRSKTPEFTLSYALFYEGIKSIMFSGGLTAEELFQWILTIKEVLKEASPEDDLASVLWRNSSPNIKVSLYNLFTDMTDLGTGELNKLQIDEEEFDDAFLKEVYEGEFSESNRSVESSSQVQDAAWDLPSGDLLIQKLANLGVYDSKAADRLKSELADAAISDRAKKIIRFTPGEIDHLRKEMEVYDENQVDFNCLVYYLSFFETSKEVASSSPLIGSIHQIITGVVSRFHAGLLLFVMKQFKLWSRDPKLADRHRILEGDIKKAFDEENHLRTLAEAFGVESRTKIAKELLTFCNTKNYHSLFSYLVHQGNRAAAENFLEHLIASGANLEEFLSGWGEKEIADALPILITREWPGKDAFLIRCLRSRNLFIAEVAAENIHKMNIGPPEALQIFKKSNESVQNKWLATLARSPVSESWKDFVRKGIEFGVWRESNEELMASWLAVGFKYLGKQNGEMLSDYVTSRRFIFFPRYPKEREAILSVALAQRDPQISLFVRNWANRERKLWFQSSDLKKKLETRT